MSIPMESSWGGGAVIFTTREREVYNAWCNRVEIKLFDRDYVLNASESSIAANGDFYGLLAFQQVTPA